MSGGPPDDRRGRGPPDEPGPRGPPEDRPGRGPPAEDDETAPIRTSGDLSHELDDLRNALTPAIRRELEALPRVETIGIGTEFNDGDEHPVIRVLVSGPHPGHGESGIPETVDLEIGEIPTSVVSIGGKFTPDSGSETHPGTGSPHRQKRIRPMPGGVEIGRVGVPASSTALVRFQEEPYIVMARHAVANGRVDPTGVPVYSPATANSSTRIGEVAHVGAWHRGTHRSPADAVLVSVEENNGVLTASPDYLGHTVARGTTRNVSTGGRRPVHMAATSGFAGGSVIATDVDAPVEYGFGEIRYENLIVTDLPGGSGASGAAVGVFNRSTERLLLVGIHIASSPNAGLVVPWDNLRDAFGDRVAPAQR